MQTCQNNIEDSVNELVSRSKELCFMTREDIFKYMADIAFVSNNLTNDIRTIDKAIVNLEKNIRIQNQGSGLTEAQLSKLAKKECGELIAEKDWSKTQLSLLNSLRISALSAQKTL